MPLTFVRPDLGSFCRLDELGLQVVGQRLEPGRAVLAHRWQDWRGAGRESSGRLDEAQLLEHRHAVVEADLFGDQAVDDLEDGGAGEPHRLAAAGG